MKAYNVAGLLFDLGWRSVGDAQHDQITRAVLNDALLDAIFEDRKQIKIAEMDEACQPVAADGAGAEQNNILWVAGSRVVQSGNQWHFHGVFTSREKAIEALRESPQIRWIVPVEADKGMHKIDLAKVLYVEE